MGLAKASSDPLSRKDGNMLKIFLAAIIAVPTLTFTTGIYCLLIAASRSDKYLAKSYKELENECYHRKG